jgi:predicted transcriptional regulator
MTDANEMNETLITLTADIVAAHVSNNSVSVNDLPTLISNVHGALSGLNSGASAAAEPAAAEKRQPAVSVRSSVKNDHVVCLYDGKKMKMLKRHLMTDHGVTPAEYREEFGLPASYPMVAPAYAEQRRTLAKSIGLGTKRKRGSK